VRARIDASDGVKMLMGVLSFFDLDLAKVG